LLVGGSVAIGASFLLLVLIIAGSGLFGDDSVSAWNVAKTFVADDLKSPTTAQFPGYDASFVTKTGDREYRVSSWVDSQNGFGAMVRSDWSCVVHFTGSASWTCYDVQITGR
jgi:hypothetical protein